MNEHLCLGGPFSGQKIAWEVAMQNGYTQFNCAHRVARTQRQRRRAIAQGKVVPPSMVFLHDNYFREEK